MKTQSAIVPLSIEIDENIYNCMQDFLAANPQWNRDKLIDASVSLFLMQNHQAIKPKDFQDCSKTYLHSICGVAEYHPQN